MVLQTPVGPACVTFLLTEAATKTIKGKSFFKRHLQKAACGICNKGLLKINAWFAELGGVRELKKKRKKKKIKTQ